MPHKNIDRRQFLTKSIKTGAILSAGSIIGSSFISSCIVTKNTSSGAGNTGFTQTPLPYAYTALTEAIDAVTMEIHYSKHAAAYAKNLNDAAVKEGINTKGSLETVLSKVSKYSDAVRNNGGGHYNHELFWKILSPNSGALSGKLQEAINSSFGSFEAFKTEMNDAGAKRFGSGWAWLYIDKDKRLKIGSSPNQDNPLMDISPLKGQPVMGVDVWEHAYYLRYQNKRAEYLEKIWKIFNWDFIGKRYESLI